MRAAEVSLGQGDEQFVDKCQALRDKLDLLLQTLQFEETGSLQQEELQQVVRFFSTVSMVCRSDVNHWVPHTKYFRTSQIFSLSVL